MNAKPKVYFCLPPRMMNTFAEKYAEDKIERLFQCEVLNDHFYGKDGNTSCFDVLCDCAGLAIYPHSYEKFDQRMQFAIEVMWALKRRVFLMLTDYTLREVFQIPKRKELQNGDLLSVDGGQAA